MKQWEPGDLNRCPARAIGLCWNRDWPDQIV